MITEQQRLDRMKGIGGSDMPIILGLSSYKTPYQLFLEKTGLLDSSSDETPLQYWGNRLECIIRDEFSTRNKVIVDTPDTIIHPFYDYLRGNVDGFIPEWNSVLEVKSSMQFMAHEWGEDGSDVIPMAYLVQVAHYCSCLNADSAYIAVLIGGHDYREFKYTRDLELESTVIKAATEFWNAVQTNKAPPASNIPDLKLMFPKNDPNKITVINEEAAQHLSSLADVKIKMKELTELENQFKFNIMQYMQDAECLTDADGKPLCSWKANKNGTRTFLLKGV